MKLCLDKSAAGGAFADDIMEVIMNYKMMGRFIGKMLIVEAVFMLPALLISLFEGERSSVLAFLVSIAAIAAVAAGLLLIGRGSKINFMPEKD